MMNRYVSRMNRQQARDQKHGRIRIPFNLQLFAEDGGDSGDDGSDDGDDGSDDDDDKGGEPEKKYTDADIDKIVKERLARERKAAEKKARQQAEAEKLKNMTAAEKRDAEFEQMKKELAELKAEKQNADMLSTASDILKDAGINVSSKLVGHLIADTADETKANVDEFVKLYNDAVNKGVKAAMKASGSNPKKSGTSTLTKEEIMKVKNPSERQKLIKENMHLFR
jgi:hypothetical protein